MLVSFSFILLLLVIIFSRSCSNRVNNRFNESELILGCWRNVIKSISLTAVLKLYALCRSTSKGWKTQWSSAQFELDFHKAFRSACWGCFQLTVFVVALKIPLIKKTTVCSAHLAWVSKEIFLGNVSRLDLDVLGVLVSFPFSGVYLFHCYPQGRWGRLNIEGNNKDRQTDRLKCVTGT